MGLAMQERQFLQWFALGVAAASAAAYLIWRGRPGWQAVSSAMARVDDELNLSSPREAAYH